MAEWRIERASDRGPIAREWGGRPGGKQKKRETRPQLTASAFFEPESSAAAPAARNPRLAWRRETADVATAERLVGRAAPRAEQACAIIFLLVGGDGGWFFFCVASFARAGLLVVVEQLASDGERDTGSS